eukprot:GHVU01203419.1.p1 GENE.GHVU01203419.1~~GHVU01203419.1.p1  ORF type:complete len:171 (+),score=5.83 GHVU01203419.1:38-514(+)
MTEPPTPGDPTKTEGPRIGSASGLDSVENTITASEPIYYSSTADGTGLRVATVYAVGQESAESIPFRFATLTPPVCQDVANKVRARLLNKEFVPSLELASALFMLRRLEHDPNASRQWIEPEPNTTVEDGDYFYLLAGTGARICQRPRRSKIPPLECD